MFVEARTELRWLIRDGIDAALEFATLGEYRLPDPRPDAYGDAPALEACGSPTHASGRGRDACSSGLAASVAAASPLRPPRSRERSAPI